MLFRYFLLAFATLLLANCSKDDDVLFTIPYQLNFSTPAGLNPIETHYFEFFNIPSRMDSILVARGMTKEDISRISPKSAELTSLFSDGEYGFIREATIDLFESGSTVFREAFFHPEVPSNTGSRLSLAGSLIDANQNVSAEKFNIRVGWKLRTIAPTSMEHILRFTFAIK